MIHPNVVTEFSPTAEEPQVAPTAFVHPLAAVVGNVSVGEQVMVSPGASIRGDEGRPLCIGDESNVQDGVVIHALETMHQGNPVPENMVEHEGRQYAVYLGRRVSLAHQAQVHGPALVGDDTFIGMQSLVLMSRVGPRCVVEPRCFLMGVSVPEGRYVPAGTMLNTQAAADSLPEITPEYPLRNLNQDVVRVNTELAKGYLQAGM